MPPADPSTATLVALAAVAEKARRCEALKMERVTWRENMVVVVVGVVMERENVEVDVAVFHFQPLTFQCSCRVTLLAKFVPQIVGGQELFPSFVPIESASRLPH